MEQKINIAELLKDCPKGMELDCTIWDNVVLAHVDINSKYPIWIKKMEGEIEFLTENGCFNFDCSAKCVIFPKGKTTWEGFVPPCEFKDGDIVATDTGSWIGITTGGKSNCFMPTYCVIKSNNDFEAYLDYKEKWHFHRLANEEEKQKLFDAIKDKGYKWNEETKSLEKLPKFQVGDNIKHKNSGICCTLGEYSEGISAYRTDIGGLSITYKDMEQWELAPNKFDITTLKPFDKVLVRDNNEQFWTCDWFSFHDTRQVYPFVCVGHYVSQCIPYEGNKHLLGTTDDCDDFYKNW